MAALPDDALARALAAVELASSSPARSRRLADQVRASPGAPPEARSVATRALGLAALAVGDPVGAVHHLRQAARLAERAGLAERTVEARATLVLALAATGAMRAALAEADRADRFAQGRSAAIVAFDRAVVLSRLGRNDEALAFYNRALGVFVRCGDAHAQAQTLGNRGVLRAYSGRWSAAVSDLKRAEAIHRAAGRLFATAQVIHNQGFVLSLRGDVPGALARYDDAAAQFSAIDGDAGLLLADRAEVLLSVRLVTEARAAAGAAVADYARRRMVANLAEARLVLGRAELLADDHAAARRTAGQARRAFRHQGRVGWAALAGSVEIQANWMGGRRGPKMLAAARRSADELADAGLAGPALDARVLAATLALEQGDTALAANELVSAAKARHRGPADQRARAWHAQALLRLADGDRAGAATAIRAGIGVVDRFRATLGATELRAGATGHGTDLAALGMRLALDAGRPGAVLAWAERCRASTLLLRPARPPRQAGLASRTAELRRVVRSTEEAALEGRPTAALLRRQAELEEAVRSAARHASGRWSGQSAAPPQVATLADALGTGRALVEYLEQDQELHAVVVAGRRATLHRLGRRADVEREVATLRFALRRMAHGVDPTGAATRSAEVSARRLDDTLMAPLLGNIGDRDVVVVPTGALASLPWCALPTLASRATSVAPSAAMWLRASGAPSRRGRRPVVLVAGPGLPAAAAEVRGLSRHYTGAVHLAGRRASVAAVTGALDGAGLAHIAAHGSFRADNPLFSCLHLADGPLTVYDLEGLRRAPEVVVLSACDSALADVGPGDELVGLASALFALGTRVLVATVVPVPDAATRTFMTLLHRRLRSGLRPAPALAAARTDARRQPALSVAAAGFVCLGAG